MNTLHRIALLTITLVLCAPRVQAAVFEIEGVALIEESLPRAREAALQNAKEQAAKRLADATQPADPAGSKDVATAGMTTADAKIGQTVVLREWQDDNTYHVLIAVNPDWISDSSANGPHPFRKKITAVPFNVQKPFQTDDIDNISAGFPLELSRRLENGGQFLTSISQYAISPGTNGPSTDADAIKRIALMYDSQFVVSGEILDVGDTKEGGYLGFFQHKRRRLEVEIYLYDGLSGALLARHRLDNSAVIENRTDRSMAFASASFFATSFGQVIDKSLESATGLLAWDIDKLPFAAKIIRINNDGIYIDAGSSSLVAVGDKLMAYHLKPTSISGLGPNSNFGAPDTAAGFVSVIQVRSKFSICTLPESDQIFNLKVGDMVRFEPAAPHPH